MWERGEIERLMDEGGGREEGEDPQQVSRALRITSPNPTLDSVRSLKIIHRKCSMGTCRADGLKGWYRIG